ncbi:MAG TPA: RNA 2',3'-cyclic phosphodiesterase [Bacteroidales bacterium]|nr:RNA 2',3'-cyclic phosphodiesterase [Bacteroidales bacterium]
MKKRLFIALPLTIRGHVDINEWVTDKAINENEISWVKPENWHLTLHFLGETNVSDIPALKRMIDEVCREFSVCEAEMKGMGSFANLKLPKVLWLGFNGVQSVISAQKIMADKLSGLGFVVETRLFKPHLTVGRIKRLGNVKALNSLLNKYKNSFFAKVQFDRIVLFESILTPQGPVYKEIHTAYLTGHL